MVGCIRRAKRTDWKGVGSGSGEPVYRHVAGGFRRELTPIPVCPAGFEFKAGEPGHEVEHSARCTDAAYDRSVHPVHPKYPG